METSLRERICYANQKAFRIIVEGEPIWRDVLPASEVFPRLKEGIVLHAGPAATFDELPTASQNSILGSLELEGLASNQSSARELLLSGEVILSPGMDWGVPCSALNPTTCSTPLVIVEERNHGVQAYSAMHEGSGIQGLRWGIFNDQIKDHMVWIREQVAPVIGRALRRMGGIQLVPLIATSLQMGDENHSLERANSLMLAMELAPAIAQLGLHSKETALVLEFLRTADRFALSVMMAASLCVLRTVENIQDCGLVTAMGGNGVNFGIRISAFGDQWFEAPSPNANGVYVAPDLEVEDTVPLVGDSTIIEAYGLGGFAAAAAPQVGMLTGGTVQELMDRSRRMSMITVGNNPNYRLPYLDFTGVPTGIDVLKVVENGIEPIVHAGIPLASGGYAGAGVANLPMACFQAAYRELVGELDPS